MAKIIELPKLSPTMEEGTLVRWAKQEGEPVAVDDLLAEVETDKATMEFRSFDRGTLLKRLVAEGAVAKLGQPVAIFGAPGEDITALLARIPGAEGLASRPPMPSNQTPTARPPQMPPVAAPAEVAEEPRIPAAPQAPAVRPPALPPEPVAGLPGMLLVPSTPRVRRLARERGIALEEVPGTGEHGRVVEQDLARAAAPPAAPATAGLRPDDVVRTPSATRRTIARRITEAKQTIPHFYLEADLDAAPLAALREEINEGAPPEDKVSLNDLFVRAAALALRLVPESNASWIDGQIVQHGRADISIAVAIEDGLLTPVVRGADALTVRGIARATRDLVARARARKLRPEEMQGGVFSVSNLGMYDIDRFSAVINPPEGMILAVGAVRDVPVVRAGQVVPGRRCAVTLSCDHRVVDGALGARFLKALRELIEHPLRILA